MNRDLTWLEVIVRDGLTSVLVGASGGDSDGDVAGADADQGPAHLSAITSGDGADGLGKRLALSQFSTTDYLHGGGCGEGVGLADVGDGGGDRELLADGDGGAVSGC